MIGYIEGKLLRMEEDRVLVLANQVGYEILLPGVVFGRLRDKVPGDAIALYTIYHQTERQPKPVLIGFSYQDEKAFFELFITVSAIGPLKAIKALTLPVEEIATAIETRDVQRLSALKGIGKRTAEKIVATLQGKMERFSLNSSKTGEVQLPDNDFRQQVMEVLIGQMGHRTSEARRMIEEALERNPTIQSADTLIDEIYKGRHAQ